MSFPDRVSSAELISSSAVSSGIMISSSSPSRLSSGLASSAGAYVSDSGSKSNASLSVLI